jgi:hypothetical protein
MSEYNKKYEEVKTIKHSFVVRDNDETKFTAIRIDEGEFKDVIYAYNEVQVGEENQNGGLNLHFTVLIIKCINDNHVKQESEFHQVCGDILVSCIEKGIKKEDEVDIIYRDNNSESLADQRRLQSEGITVSED